MFHALQAVRATLAALLVLAAAGPLAAQDTKPLPPPPSPGQAIQDAARASTPYHQKFPGIEVLTDTQGVDFGPYLQDVVATVRRNWYQLIPASAQLKKGKLAIELKILKNGEVGNMKLVASAGAELDRPAWGSITASNPFKPLPDAFHGPYLALRFRYLYNPDKSDVENSGVSNSGPAAPPIQQVAASPIQRAVLIQSAADSHPIKYPKKAVREKTDGVVRLMVRIAPDGSVQSAAAVEGSLLLGDAASEAMRKWRFQPAQQDGKPVEADVRIRVEFRLEGQQVRWKIFPSQSSSTARP